jgi:predicted transposase/invertase (TIGR01784 family)
VPKLEYTLKNDLLFKMLFVKHPNLLRRLAADILKIPVDSISEFRIQNGEIPPEAIGDKFCRLDINMKVNGQLVDLEIQVGREAGYIERTMYYWAREFSTALGSGEQYALLPRTVIVSIVDYAVFECEEYHSEYQLLEVTRHTPLSDKALYHYFELPKLPKAVDAGDDMQLWLRLFDAGTDEDLGKLEKTGVNIMQQAIDAYRSVTATDEFRTLERMRADARHNEASALGAARREEAERWKGAMDAAIADKDATIADMGATIAELRAQLKAQLEKGR